MRPKCHRRCKSTTCAKAPGILTDAGPTDTLEQGRIQRRLSQRRANLHLQPKQGIQTRTNDARPTLTYPKDHRVNGRVIVARGVEVSRDNLTRGWIRSASDGANAARPDAEDAHALVQSEGSPTPELLGLLHLRENRRLYCVYLAYFLAVQTLRSFLAYLATLQSVTTPDPEI